MVITNLRSIFHYSATVINYSNPTRGYGKESKGLALCLDLGLGLCLDLGLGLGLVL